MFDSLQHSVTSALRGSDALLQPPWTPTYTYTEVKLKHLNVKYIYKILSNFLLCMQQYVIAMQHEMYLFSFA